MEREQKRSPLKGHWLGCRFGVLMLCGRTESARQHAPSLRLFSCLRVSIPASWWSCWKLGLCKSLGLCCCRNPENSLHRHAMHAGWCLVDAGRSLMHSRWRLIHKVHSWWRSRRRRAWAETGAATPCRVHVIEIILIGPPLDAISGGDGGLTAFVHAVILVIRFRIKVSKQAQSRVRV